MDKIPLLIIIALASGSLGLTLFSVTRVLHYIQAYRFEDVRYKPLCGFIHLRFVLFFYLLLTLLIAGFSISFLI